MLRQWFIFNYETVVREESGEKSLQMAQDEGKVLVSYMYVTTPTETNERHFAHLVVNLESRQVHEAGELKCHRVKYCPQLEMRVVDHESKQSNRIHGLLRVRWRWEGEARSVQHDDGGKGRGNTLNKRVFAVIMGSHVASHAGATTRRIVNRKKVPRTQRHKVSAGFPWWQPKTSHVR